jgi:hypothetical protein
MTIRLCELCGLCGEKAFQPGRAGKGVTIAGTMAAMAKVNFCGTPC